MGLKTSHLNTLKRRLAYLQKRECPEDTANSYIRAEIAALEAVLLSVRETVSESV